MKIKRKISQHRRDFTAIYECEHCEMRERATGYDDENFHQNVIPNMKCGSCGKTAGDNYVPLAPRYNSDDVV